MSIPTTTSQILGAGSPEPHPATSDTDIACRPSSKESNPDIEHVPVNDDPRQWSHTTTLWIVSVASMISTLASNIQNPTDAIIEQELHANSIQISWVLAAFTFVQGNFPLIWSTASEIKGRKLVYIAATSIFVLGCVILANAATINVLIGMRVMQAAGSSAAITISAATLADIYETHERGTMMGIFYAAPLLGPALGPIIGGFLSQAFGWRASFYFLFACGVILLAAFVFLFKDTFRFERSLTYQAALARRTHAARNLGCSTVPMAAANKTETEEKQASSKNLTSQSSSIEDGIPAIKVEAGMAEVGLSFSDMNPFPPLWKVMRRKNNIAILFANGLVFAFSYSLSYTCARTLSKEYGYEPLTIGLVLLSLGAGSIGGSVIGGRWSDHVVMKLKKENKGEWYPEMRLNSATLAMVWLPPSIIAYGWVAAEARSHWCDLPDAILVRILFDMDVHEYAGSLSRRSVPSPATSSTSAPAQEHADNTHPPRRSLPRRILSALPKPSLGSRPLVSSLTLPTHTEQTLRGKKRRWGLSRRHKVSSNIERAIPEHTDPSTANDEQQVDRDVDEFGVITPRVPDSHTHSPATSAKGKEKAKDLPDVNDVNQDHHSLPVASSSNPSPPAHSDPGTDHFDQVVIAPTVPPSPPRQNLSLPPTPEPERLSLPLPSVPTPTSPPQPSIQSPNSSPRPFPPPGTLVVVQGVVHTTDVPRSSERPAATPSPTPPTIDDATHSNTTPNLEPTRPSSVPPGTPSRNRLSGILPRPASMVPGVSAPATVDFSGTDTQARPTASSPGPVEDSEDEDRTNAHPHGISMTQGPVGGSGLSASSIDVLGTLLSVAAAATAASLLTGSSEPIFSSGLTSPQPPPPSNSIHPPPSFSSSIPSERPLSPTPTSDTGRMRHVWSSLRDRLGLGSGGHNSNNSSDVTSNSGPGQSAPSQPSDILHPRDPREIMLAEMARAFNLGLGLGGTPANSNISEGTVSDPTDAPAGEREGEHPSLPPPDSFERFLMDLQTDLRVTLMQDQNPGAPGGLPQDPVQDGEDQPMPELQSLTDSDSGGFGTVQFDSDEDEPDYEEDVDAEDDTEDAHTAQEPLSGRTSPAVSALGTSLHSPFDPRTRVGSTSSLCPGGMSPSLTAPSQPISTATLSSSSGDISSSNPVPDNDKGGNVDIAHSSSSVAIGTGTHVPGDSCPSEMLPARGPEGQGEGAVLGVAHSRDASNEGHRVEVEGAPVSGTVAVQSVDTQDPSNLPGTGTARESFLLGPSSLSGPPSSNTPDSLPEGSTFTPSNRALPSTPTLPIPSIPASTTQSSSPTNPTLADSSMPFRLPFTSGSTSRTERGPGGGINWWRMYRFPAITSPNIGSQGGQQGSMPQLQPQPVLPTPAQGSNHASASPWARATDQNQQNETTTPRILAHGPSVDSGLTQPALVPSAATSTDVAETVSTPNRSTSTPPSTIGQDSDTSTNTSTNLPGHRSNVVVPVIVVGLQSVNMDRPPPHTPDPHVPHAPAMDEEDADGTDFDGLEQSMSMPLHIPEPAEFRRHSSPPNTTLQGQGGQQPQRGRTWQSRAANAIRSLRPSRRNADAASPQPQETPGSRTFLIYVIGGYYPPDHQIITGGNLDSFEALWELAELLGQVKPPTVSKDEIEKSGLEIIKASSLEQYEKEGCVASNCVDRCLICLDDYNPEDDLRVLKCKHTFHQGCVDRWLETGRNNCPACRTKGVGNEDVGPTSATSSDLLFPDS
ncbi:hypothetical protein JVU11DRAFT_3314 [Chiua virens]|nr:hypothetical protein JVU11DRAFT_3314 [Chiua virens]